MSTVPDILTLTHVQGNMSSLFTDDPMQISENGNKTR